MIQIRNLSFSYPGSLTPQLNQVNLNINKGEFIAIVGENGCGKSTLCKSINGLIPHFFSGDYSGSVTISGVEVESSSISYLAQKIGYVYQDFENQIVRPKILEDASFASMNYAYENYLDKGRDALIEVGLGERESDYIWQLSGGQKHLLALAGSLALNPEILVLDEPIAQLDPIHAKDIYNLLESLNQKEEKTIIVIEHHCEFIAQYCSHVIMMKKGKVIWKLPVKEALNRIEELHAVNVYPPQVTLAANILPRANKYKNDLLPITLEEAIEYFEKTRIKKNSLVNNFESINKKNFGEEIVSLKSIKLYFDTVKGPKTKIFDDIDLTMYKGQNIGIIGNNGAGKTSLFRLIAGVIKATEGNIFIKGTETTRCSPEKIANYISLVYQNPEQMFICDSIYADIVHAMKARKISDYNEQAQILLEKFDLEEIKSCDGRLLSGGQMRRASIAVGIALKPPVILLDEPTANLDIATRKSIIKMLNGMKGMVDVVAIASHDMQLICEWADRIIVLNDGKIIADGTREKIFSDNYLLKLAGIVPPSIHSLSKSIDKNSMCFTLEEFVNCFQHEEVI